MPMTCHSKHGKSRTGLGQARPRRARKRTHEKMRKDTENTQTAARSLQRLWNTAGVLERKSRGLSERRCRKRYRDAGKRKATELVSLWETWQRKDTLLQRSLQKIHREGFGGWIGKGMFRVIDADIASCESGVR